MCGFPNVLLTLMAQYSLYPYMISIMLYFADQAASATVETNAAPTPSSGRGQAAEPDARPAQQDSVAAKPDPGISRRVRVGPKKKKDLGPLGNLGHNLSHFTHKKGEICNCTAGKGGVVGHT